MTSKTSTSRSTNSSGLFESIIQTSWLRLDWRDCRQASAAGKIQAVYGKAMDEVEKELTKWQNMQKDNEQRTKETKVH